MCNIYLIASILLTTILRGQLTYLISNSSMKYACSFFKVYCLYCVIYLLFSLAIQMEPEIRYEELSYIGTVQHNKEAKVQYFILFMKSSSSETVKDFLNRPRQEFSVCFCKECQVCASAFLFFVSFQLPYIQNKP